MSVNKHVCMRNGKPFRNELIRGGRLVFCLIIFAALYSEGESGDYSLLMHTQKKI